MGGGLDHPPGDAVRGDPVAAAIAGVLSRGEPTRAERARRVQGKKTGLQHGRRAGCGLWRRASCAAGSARGALGQAVPGAAPPAGGGDWAIRVGQHYVSRRHYQDAAANAGDGSGERGGDGCWRHNDGTCILRRPFPQSGTPDACLSRVLQPLMSPIRGKRARIFGMQTCRVPPLPSQQLPEMVEIHPPYLTSAFRMCRTRALYRARCLGNT